MIERTLHADFEDLYVVNENEVRETYSEFYGKKYALKVKHELLAKGVPAVIGRTIRFTLKDE